MKKLLIILFLGLSTSAFAQNSFKGAVTQIMNAGRIVDGEEVTSLPYTKGAGSPFSIMIIPKSQDNLKEIEMVKGKYYQGDIVRLIPISINQWNTVSLIQIDSDNPSLFTNYYVYVGFGQDIPGL